MKQQKRHARKVLRLRQLRRGVELTQADLARRVRLSTSVISSYERGTIKPSLDKAREIAAFFGRPIEEVFSWVDVDVKQPREADVA